MKTGPRLSNSQGASIELSQSGATALITINRPHRLNAIDPEASRALLNYFDELAKDRSVRTVVLTGSGDRAFSAGADIKWMADHPDATPDAWVHRRVLRELYPKPIIAAIRGFCLGGGLELASAADIIVAGSDAQFGFPELAAVGTYPGDGGPLRAPRQLPYRVAVDLLLTGRRLSAAEAYGLGFVNEVVAPEHVVEAALAKAELINARPALAVQITKALVLQGLDMPLFDRSSEPGAWSLYGEAEKKLHESEEWRGRSKPSPSRE
jgi:enoyl-CoA hydratase/carnithine racemase